MKMPLVTEEAIGAEEFQQAATAHLGRPLSPTETELRTALEEAKAALRHSETLFQTTFDQAAVGMAHATLTGNWLRINQRFCAIVGYSLEELRQIPFYELTHPADRTKDHLAIRQLLAGEIRSYGTTKRYLHKNGHIVWAKLTLSLAYTSSGQPDYFVSVIEDITAQKMLQIAEEQQRQFAEALNNSLVALTSTLDVDAVMQQILTSAVTVVPCEAGSIILFEENRGRVAYLHGYSSEAAAFFHTYAFPLDSATVGDALRYNRPYLIKDTQIVEHWLPLPVTQWVRATIGVPITQQGVVLGLLILDSATPHHFQPADIETLQAFARYASLALENALHTSRLEQRVTERTAELQSAKEQTEAIFNNSLDAILLLQPDLTIKRSNAVFATLLACQETPSYSILRYLHEADVAQVMNCVDTVLHKQAGCHLEVCVYRCDGTGFDAELSFGPLTADELVLTLRDVTERKARERQLRFYASLQENVSDAVIALDLNWQIQSWNHAAETIYGWRAAEAVGQNCTQLLQTRLLSGIPIEQFKQQLLEQGHFHGEVRQRCKDGDELYLLASATLFKDESGKPIGIVVINHDISERKQVEEALIQYAAEVEDLYNNAPCGYYSIDQNATVIQVNDTALQWLGYKRHEVVGVRKITELLTPASSNIFWEHFPTFQATGSIKDVEFEIVRKDGTIMHALLSSTVVYDEQGHYLRDRAAFYDITALKQAQDTLRESEARYRFLTENISDSIVRIDAHGDCVYVSPSIYNILGYTPAELQGQSMYALLHAEDSAHTRGYPTVPAKPEQAMPITVYRVRHKAGHYVWLEFRSQAIFDAKGETLLGFISTARDITERKHAEETLLQKMEEERVFQGYLKTLHEITIDLTQLDWLDDFYRRAIELGIERLGFDRLGLLLYDAESNVAVGSYGTDRQGTVVAEPHIRQAIDSYGGILQQALTSSERFCFNESVPLYSDFEFIGFGWNALAVLRHGQQVLGWLSADNGIQHKPISKPQLEILALYSLSLSTLLARKQVILALRESEHKFRQVVTAAPVAILISNDAGAITLVNNQAELLFGYKSAELLTHPIEILVPETVQSVHPAHRDSYLIGAKLRQPERVAELQARRKDGSLFPVEIKLSHIETADGLLVMSFLTDISARKTAERELRAQRDFLQLVIDTIPDFIAVKDQAGRFQLANRRIAEIYGTTPTALIGVCEIDIHADQNEVARFQSQDQQALLSGEPLFIPEDAFGESYYQINVIPLKNQAGTFDRLLVVGSDITERKRAEEALQQALKKEKELGELKSRFVSMASHEFRTPLTSIMVLTETLSNYRHKLTDEQIAQRLHKIQEQIGHLKTIMDDVLQLARIQARRMEFTPTAVDLDELCNSVLEEFIGQPTTAQRLCYRHDTGIPPLNLDKRLMRQIISNLLSNALKYSAVEKPVELQLAYTEGAVVLQVRDQGIGIPADDFKHLFEPFHRATNVGTISGTGLGLSITKESVELHGGSITVESLLGVGTTFTVTLPTTTANAYEPVQAE